jgi:hypothetical protein
MHFKNGKLNYDSNTITDKFREFEIDYRDSENVVAFAIACIDMNSIDDLLECTKHAKQADMEQWKISEKQWREAVDAALNGKLYRLVSDLMEHLNSVSSRGHLSEELDNLVDKLISELRKLDLEFTRYDSNFEDLPYQITDAISISDFSDAADFYRQHFRIEPSNVCFEDNENGIFRIDDAAISEVIAEFTFEDDE